MRNRNQWILNYLENVNVELNYIYNNTSELENWFEKDEDDYQHEVFGKKRPLISNSLLKILKYLDLVEQWSFNRYKPRYERFKLQILSWFLTIEQNMIWWKYDFFGELKAFIKWSEIEIDFFKNKFFQK